MAVDYYLQIPGIPGDSKEMRHRDWIELDSYSFGISNSTDPGRGAASTKSVASFSEFSFQKRADRATPKIFGAICKGMHIPELTFAAKKGGAKEGHADFLVVKFRDCIISTLQQSGGGAVDVMPMENVSFAYSQVEFEYRLIDVKGNVQPATAFKYDIKRNMKL